MERLLCPRCQAAAGGIRTTVSDNGEIIHETANCGHVINSYVPDHLDDHHGVGPDVWLSEETQREIETIRCRRSLEEGQRLTEDQIVADALDAYSETKIRADGGER